MRGAPTLLLIQSCRFEGVNWGKLNTKNLIQCGDGRLEKNLEFSDFYGRLKIDKFGHFGLYFRDIGYINRKTTITYRNKRQRAKKRFIIFIVLTRHHKPKYACVKMQTIGIIA